jgi:hypothetical protein
LIAEVQIKKVEDMQWLTFILVFCNSHEVPDSNFMGLAVSIVVRSSVFHLEDPDSIPPWGVIL